MRSEEEIRTMLIECFNDYERTPNALNDGWIKALKWVLNDKGEK
ncbi:MAG TPA: hypothetical protein VGB78_08895 [Thermoplasmata archaeon]